MEILLQLFISFATVGLFCVGGGYASMPLIQAEVIDKHAWLTMNEFVDIFTLSQMTPGPIGINAATFVGSKVAGIPGSLAATAGFVFPSVFIVLFLGYLYYKYGDVAAVRGILNGLRPAVVALIGSAGVNFSVLGQRKTTDRCGADGFDCRSDFCSGTGCSEKEIGNHQTAGFFRRGGAVVLYDYRHSSVTLEGIPMVIIQTLLSSFFIWCIIIAFFVAGRKEECRFFGKKYCVE